jgi:cytochrome c5
VKAASWGFVRWLDREWSDKDQRRNNMSRRTTAVLAVTLVALVFGSLLAACGGGAKEETAPPAKEEAAPAALDGKSLVEERCTKCHDLGRVEKAKKTEEEWKTTVERMVGKGAELNQAEQEAVIKYLAETYPK